MNNVKILVCIVFMIFLVVTSVIKIITSLNDQPTSSFEIAEDDKDFEESANNFNSTESISLFYGKFYTMFQNRPCMYLPIITFQMMDPELQIGQTLTWMLV